MSDVDLAVVATHADLVACLDRLYIRADSPSYRDLEQRTARLSGELPGTGLKRVRLGRSAIGELLRGSTFPKKAFLLTFVEACGVDVAADQRWAEAWDRLSERYVKRAGQAQTELAQLRAEAARLRAEVDTERRTAKEAQAEEAGLRAQLAATTQNAEKAQLEALDQIERTQRQLTDAQNEIARLREEVRELAEELEGQEREAVRPRDLAPPAADSHDYRAVPGYSRDDVSGYGAPPQPADPADSESPAAPVPAAPVPAAAASYRPPDSSSWRDVLPSGYGGPGYLTDSPDNGRAGHERSR